MHDHTPSKQSLEYRQTPYVDRTKEMGASHCTGGVRCNLLLLGGDRQKA